MFRRAKPSGRGLGNFKGEAMAKKPKEKKQGCPKCESTEFSTDDKSEKRFCTKCRHVWVPGLIDVATRPDLVMAQVQTENFALKLEIDKLRKRLKEVEALLPEPAAKDKTELDPIFDL